MNTLIPRKENILNALRITQILEFKYPAAIGGGVVKGTGRLLTLLLCVWRLPVFSPLPFWAGLISKRRLHTWPLFFLYLLLPC